VKAGRSLTASAYGEFSCDTGLSKTRSGVHLRVPARAGRVVGSTTRLKPACRSRRAGGTWILLPRGRVFCNAVRGRLIAISAEVRYGF